MHHKPHDIWTLLHRLLTCHGTDAHCSILGEAAGLGPSQFQKVHQISIHHKGRQGPPKVYLSVNESLHQESQHRATLKQNNLIMNLSLISIRKKRSKSKALGLEGRHFHLQLLPNKMFYINNQNLMHCTHSTACNIRLLVCHVSVRARCDEWSEYLSLWYKSRRSFETKK